MPSYRAKDDTTGRSFNLNPKSRSFSRSRDGKRGFISEIDYPETFAQNGNDMGSRDGLNRGYNQESRREYTSPNIHMNGSSRHEFNRSSKNFTNGGRHKDRSIDNRVFNTMVLREKYKPKSLIENFIETSGRNTSKTDRESKLDHARRIKAEFCSSETPGGVKKNNKKKDLTKRLEGMASSSTR